MSLEDCGPAVVLVYGGRRLESALLHSCDGGETYMGPLLRKAVQYAKTHYDSGNILDVLMSEGEMLKLDAGNVVNECAKRKVRHVYYVSYRWSADTARKTYHVSARHLRSGFARHEEIPDFLDSDGCPAGSSRLS